MRRPPSLPAGRATVGYTATLQTSGGSGTYVWSIQSGALPSGLSLSSSTGVISGTPQAAGTYAFVVTVGDAADSTNVATASLSIAVSAAVQITTTSLPNARRNAAYSATLQAASVQGSAVWSIASGSLPPGLSLDPDRHDCGRLHRKR